MRRGQLRYGRVLVSMSVAASVAVAACSAGGSAGGRSDEHGATDGSSAPGTKGGGARLVWRACGDDGLECATLVAPLDHAHRDGSTIRLALYRHRAESHRRFGSLLVNPGGPGASGRPLAEQARKIFPDALRARFDIVAWDPRGVGASSAVRCGEHLDAFFAVDRSPDTPAEVRVNVTAAKALAQRCAAGSGSLLEHVSSTESVADMDDIRAALGDARLTYLGFSYGTYLGALYAVTFPTHVRALVLDGAVDPALDPSTSTLQQSVAFEASLDAFLADCSRRSACVFHSSGRAANALHRLLAQIDAEPLRAEVDGESRTLGRDEATIGMASALYSGRESWDGLATALADAAQGDGSGLLRLSDDYTERQSDGSYTNGQEAYYAISCPDGQGDATLSQVEADARATARVAPVFGPTNAWLGLPCVYWPAPVTVRPAALRAPRGLSPVVVITSTRDPATPRTWGIALAAQLRARLVTGDTDTHTAFVGGGPCVQDPVVAYLVTGHAPGANLFCPAS